MITIISEKRPGGSALKKPKELKGVKPLFTIKWGGVTSCQVFVQEDDIWIKHNDWCSLILYGIKPKSKRNFVYSDCFTSPVIKGQAWIRLDNILKQDSFYIAWNTIVQECYSEQSRFCSDDERLFSDVLRKVWFDRREYYV